MEPTAKFGAALPPDQMVQKYARTLPDDGIPFLTEEDDFPRWPLFLGVVVAATGAGWLVGTIVALLGLA